MQLKINILPAFSNECCIEFKQQGDFIDLIIILSAYTEMQDSGRSYYQRIQDKKVLNAFVQHLFRMVDKPTPITEITINDGMLVKITYTNGDKLIDYQLISIQKDSIEIAFLHALFDYCVVLLRAESLGAYFEGIKRDFLSKMV